jgi:hypothetical protein
VYHKDGRVEIRQQFSHTAYPATVEGDWIRVRYGAGYIYRKWDDVKIAVKYPMVAGTRKAA